MALVKGTNSYVSVAEADAYFEDRVGAEVWPTLLLKQKEKCLISATNLFSTFDWVGTALNSSQVLAFPREGIYYEPVLGYEVDFSGTPDRIMKATFELAFHLLLNADVLDDTGSVLSLSVESVKLDTIIAPSRIPASVRKTITPLLFKQQNNSWWRAN